MWIDWDVAAWIAFGLAAGVLITRGVTGLVAVGVRATARETSLVLALYAVWQRVHELTVTKTEGAMENARWIYDFQHTLHIPDELAMQKAVLPHPWLVQALNGYYAIVHVPALIALLIWLFFRHRDQYPWVRNALALTTAGCLVLHTIPVAPPRMFPELGFVDTGLLYDQSVYGRGGSGISSQVAAMASVHVGWALIVGLAAVVISKSRWRWLVLLHPVLTVVAVTATANHWYLDGIVAGMLLGLSLVLLWLVARLRRRLDGSPPRGAQYEPGEYDAHKRTGARDLRPEGASPGDRGAGAVGGELDDPAVVAGRHP